MYANEVNKSIKVFSQLYVGTKSPIGDTPVLGFATPYETNAAGKKRQATVENWAGGHGTWNGKTHSYEYDTPNITIVDNTPRPGFKITDDVKRIYWGGGNVVFRVLDPAGFELEIQSSNLMALIQVAGINEGGVIPGSCLWGRDGANNILLHEKSEEYKNAILNAETLKKPSILSSKEIGTVYVLQNGEIGRYLGKFWVVTDDYVNTANSHRQSNEFYYNTHTKKLDKRVDQYEAVLINTIIKFYKKAPLVRIASAKDDFDITKIERLVDVTPKAFAGNAPGKIVAASRSKPIDYWYDTKIIDAEIFNEMLRRIDNYSEKNTSIWEPKLEHFMREDVNVLVDGKLFGHEITESFNNDGTITKTRMLLNQPFSKVHKCINIGSSYTIHHDHQKMNMSNSRYLDPVPLQRLIVPTFESWVEVSDWLKQKYIDGNLVSVCVKVIDKETK